MKYVKKLVLFTLFAMNLVEQPAPEVTIEQGTLTGKINADGKIFEYVGIPYATTNSDSRFQEPLPPPSWKGVYRAIDEIYACPQQVFGKIVVGTEDCLKVNVYVPSTAKKPLAVMVYIHGGAFVMGGGGKLMYGPEFLVKQDVILVTFNYRLGALGFLCLGIKEAPGNAGLKDQIAALKWVKKNIAAFGGDPDNVTVFGESAGATSTALLLASEATNGLFEKAIVQSGSSLAIWALNRQPVWIASLLVKELGYDTEDPQEIYKILSTLSYKEIININPKKQVGLYFDPNLIHLPCIEKPLPDVEPALTDLPYNLLLKKQKNVSVIYGSTSKEGYFMVMEETPDTLKDKDNNYLLTSDLEFDNDERTAEIAKTVKEFYFGKENVSPATILNLVDIYTHLYFEIPAIFESELVSASNKTSVYNYYFNYIGKRNFLKENSPFKNDKGACHADEILYLFDGRIWPFRVNDKDKIMIEWLTKMWTNFAKYGDPTPSFVSDLPVKWIPSNKESKHFLYIEDELQMGSLPNPEAYHMWKDIYEKHRRKNVNNYL
ncbi:esterase FE4-like [Aphomia sociella]